MGVGNPAVTALAAECGAVPMRIDAAAHDRWVALVSHAPHLVAAAMAEIGRMIRAATARLTIAAVTTAMMVAARSAWRIASVNATCVASPIASPIGSPGMCPIASAK